MSSCLLRTLSRRRKPVAEDGSDLLESSQSCVDLSDIAIVVSSWEDALELLGGAAFTAAAAAVLILLGNVIVAEASTSPSAFVQNVIYSTRLPSSPIPIARSQKKVRISPSMHEKSIPLSGK
ncbi:hypothetical protein ACE6H2_015986 [Prunus campanulata]